MRAGRKELASLALAAVIVAMGVAALAAWPEAREPVDAAQAPSAQGTSFRFEDEHVFLPGPSRVTFEVPENPRPANVRLWFETAATPDRSATIALQDPEGNTVLEARIDPGSVQAGSRSRVAALDQVLLAPGTWTVAYGGQGAFDGRVEVIAE